ncbi:MAG: hypothetical protein IKQ62_05760 [Bacteroidaceae bacterium]|nr:hypothetical protein [Bacteroidaceae bacterium]
MRKIVKSLLWVALLLLGCGEPQEVVVLTGEEAFREGDLVMRCGYGVESKAVTEASQSIYSHIGMLHYDGLLGQWMVVHAVPDEAERGEPEWLKCERLSDFYAADRAMRGAWMRVDCSDAVAGAAVRYALQKVKQKVVFDNDYLLSDTTSLYCTELIWQAYLHQGIDLSDSRRHDVPLLFSKDGECIFPVDIEESDKILFVQPLKTQRK